MAAALAIGAVTVADAAESIALRCPPRPAEAVPGSELARRWAHLPLTDREVAVEREILTGNIPDFLRTLSPVIVTQVDGGRTNQIRFDVTPDYLAVGSNEDYLLMPMMPGTAQRIADRLGCTLPTPRMVDAIYDAAPLKLSPAPMPPGPEMTTVPVFWKHGERVHLDRTNRLGEAPWGTLVAGHKKDVVIATRLTNAPDRVAIFGWHRSNGIPIQPLYAGHRSSWADYSHGIRLVGQAVTVNGRSGSIAEVLQTPHLCSLLSNEGLVLSPRYPTNSVSRPGGAVEQSGEPSAERPIAGEAWQEVDIDSELRVRVSVPQRQRADIPSRVVIYALPNGNTIEQTIGKRLQAGDDWHFDIQHIGAQTRFLRARTPDVRWVVAYVEAQGRSWPAWRRQRSDASTRIRTIVEALATRFGGTEARIVLAGHSGGGSFIFGYVDSVADLPRWLERIAFLDANYAYDPSKAHAEKLARWLSREPSHYLTVLAYHDSVALLNGKTFVSEAGGTWGRSHLMVTNFGAYFRFDTSNGPEMNRHEALERRMQFLLIPNPERKILHTVQVERNGFIHAMLTGTPQENSGYAYMEQRAYEQFIEP